MLAVTMILCKMRDGVTLRRAILDLQEESPNFVVSDSAQQEVSWLIYIALKKVHVNPDVDLSTLNHQELFEVAQTALDIHLGYHSIVI